MTIRKARVAIVGFGCLIAVAQLGCNGCGGGTLTGTGGGGVIHTGAAGVVGSAGITGDTGTAGNFGGDAGAGGFISTGSGARPGDCTVPAAAAGDIGSGPAALGLLAPVVYPGFAFGHGLRLGVAVGDTTGDGEPDLITVDTTVIGAPQRRRRRVRRPVRCELLARPGQQRLRRRGRRLQRRSIRRCRLPAQRQRLPQGLRRRVAQQWRPPSAGRGRDGRHRVRTGLHPGRRW